MEEDIDWQLLKRDLTAEIDNILEMAIILLDQDLRLMVKEKNEITHLVQIIRDIEVY